MESSIRSWRYEIIFIKNDLVPPTTILLIYSLVEWGIQAMVLIRGRISLYSGQIFPEMNITLLGEIAWQRFYEVDLDESHIAQYLNQILGSRVKLQCQSLTSHSQRILPFSNRLVPIPRTISSPRSHAPSEMTAALANRPETQPALRAVH